MIDNKDLAYITGFIDGEGYIGIKKDTVKGRGINPAFYGRISVASTNKEVLDFISEFFGVGNMYLHKPSKLSKKGYWSWETSNLKAIYVIKLIYPFLRIKKPEADLVLKLSKSKEKRYRILPKKVVNYREKLYQGIKDIHS